MNAQTFFLQPFLPSEQQPVTPDPLPNLKITGSIARQTNILAIRYILLGDLSDVVIAASSNPPTRQHNLWQDTCFEFFLGIKHSPQYWEFNLSPAGHWNVYRFDGYRQGMQEEAAFTSLPFHVQIQSNTLSLALNLDLKPIVPSDQALEVSITAVIKSRIESRNGEETYWALTHPGSEADFHRRDSFIIEL